MPLKEMTSAILQQVCSSTNFSCWLQNVAVVAACTDCGFLTEDICMEFLLARNGDPTWFSQISQHNHSATVPVCLCYVHHEFL